MFTRQQDVAMPDASRQTAVPPLRFAPITSELQAWTGSAAIAASRPETALIPAGAVIEGIVRAAGRVQVEGSVIGEIHCRELAIEPGGQVVGAVTAVSVAVLGLLRGRVDAETIEVASSAELDADLNFVEIAIARGARVSGTCVRREPTAASAADQTRATIPAGLSQPSLPQPLPVSHVPAALEPALPTLAFPIPAHPVPAATIAAPATSIPPAPAAPVQATSAPPPSLIDAGAVIGLDELKTRLSQVYNAGLGA